MIRGSLMNPPTGVLPFEMFRSFAPMFDKNWQVTPRTPPCDIYETDKEIVLKIELPEVKRESVEVTLVDHLLMIKGEHKFPEQTDHENYLRIERCHGEFKRSFALPANIKGAKINAELNDGVLTVTLPKHEEARPKHIQVKAKSAKAG